MSAVDSIVTISDVLRPERRVRSNELCHQLLAPCILTSTDAPRDRRSASSPRTMCLSATRLLYPADPGGPPSALPASGTHPSGATANVTDSPGPTRAGGGAV